VQIRWRPVFTQTHMKRKLLE